MVKHMVNFLLKPGQPSDAGVSPESPASGKKWKTGELLRSGPRRHLGAAIVRLPAVIPIVVNSQQQ